MLRLKRPCSLLAAFCTVILAASSVAGDTPTRLADDPRVSDAVQAWMEWVEYQAAVNNIPGVSLGIVHDQELIASDAFGFSNLQKRQLATSDTLYSICSISKLFTSVAVLQQRDAGKLRLDDAVAKHLPWFNIKDA